MAKSITYCFICKILLLSVLGCRKIDAGIKTTVAGVVYDFNKQAPIANVGIKIMEYEGGFYGPVFKRVVDSTISGSDGKYSITFITTGQGVQYKVGFEPGSNYHTIQDAVGLIVGKDTTVNFWAIGLHTLKAQIQMVNNPNPPLRVGTIAGLGGRIYGQNNDTTIFLKVVPNASNQIQFTITNVDTPTIFNYRVDTINLAGFSDTFSRVFQVDPSLFTERK